MERIVRACAVAGLLLGCSSEGGDPSGAGGGPGSTSGSGGASQNGGGGGAGAGTAASGGGGASPGDTWATFAEGFFGSYCTSCHPNQPASAEQDFTQYAEVFQYRNEIGCGVRPIEVPDPQPSCAYPAEQFPIGNGPMPTSAERARVVAWIAAGAPE
jgi:hypothetical protein